MIAFTGVQLPGNSRGQPAVQRQGRQGSGSNQPDGWPGKAIAAVRLRPGPRAKLSISAAPEWRQEAPSVASHSSSHTALFTAG